MLDIYQGVIDFKDSTVKNMYFLWWIWDYKTIFFVYLVFTVFEFLLLEICKTNTELKYYIKKANLSKSGLWHKAIIGWRCADRCCRILYC